MFCTDVLYIISSFLIKLRDIISLHNVNKYTRSCKFNVNLCSKIHIPNFVYNDYNIVKICSTFTDYSNVDKLLTDSLLHLCVSHKNKNNINILEKLPNLTNLTFFKMYSSNFDDNMFINLINLKYLDLGFYKNNNFNGHCISKLSNLEFLNSGTNFISSKYVNNLTKLEYLIINTETNDNDFEDLINLKYLDVYNSNYTLLDSNIRSLINLKYLKCKISSITSVDHLIKLETLYLGVNYTIKTITNLDNLKVLSLIDSVVEYIYLPNLIELTLNNQIGDSVLCKHNTLKYLYLGNNEIVTNVGIRNLTNLKYLHCSLNRNITNNGLYNLDKLIYLHIGQNTINIKIFKNFINLQYIERYDIHYGNILESIIILDNRYNKNDRR